jgi:hypothetical protein
MAELKTRKNELSVQKFIDTVKDKDRKKDCEAIVTLMKKATKTEPKMWGTAIIGFGSRVLKYESGRELDWFVMGFSPRKANFALYLAGGVEAQKKLLEKLGKHKTGKGCLYINSLEEVSLPVLKHVIETAAKLGKESAGVKKA